MSQSNVGRYSKADSEWWRLFFLLMGLAFALLLMGTNVKGSESSSFWRTDYKAALQEAEEKKLPLLVHFYADWCGPCQRMEREVFSTTTVKELLDRKFVAVKINSDHRQDLVQRFGVETLPSDVVVDSLNGRVIELHAGYQDRTAYLATASKAEAHFVKAHASDLVVTKSIAGSNETQPAVATKPDVAIKSDVVELGEAKPVIGLDGFSPVSLTKKRQWNRGSPRFHWDYKDVTYYLTTREELIEFRNHPETYAPKLLGCDPVILWESDKAVAGDIRYGAFFDDELFLFKSDERRRQFKANPEKFIRLQHALKADQIERTAIR